MTSASNRKMAWLWETLYHPLLATSAWSISRNGLLTQHNKKTIAVAPDVDDIYVVWPHGPEGLQNFLTQLHSFRPSIQFTMEIESDTAVPLLDVSVITKEMTLATKVYRKFETCFSYSHISFMFGLILQSLFSNRMRYFTHFCILFLLL
jgi:hypothetical protein